MIRFLLCCLLLQSAHAQSVPAGPTLRVDVNLVVMDAQVLDRKHHHPVAGMTPEDFSLYENGLKQQITFLSQDRLPLSVVFLFDLTDSVRPVLDPLAERARWRPCST